MPIIRKIIDKLNTYNYDHIIDWYIDSDNKIVLNKYNDFDIKLAEFYNFLINNELKKSNKIEIIKKIEELFEQNNRKINDKTECVNSWIDDEQKIHILVGATYWYKIEIEFIYNNNIYNIVNAMVISQNGRGGFNKYEKIKIGEFEEKDVLNICDDIINDRNDKINKLIQSHLV